jgi:AcrR family transcriptional regulator
MSNTTKSGAGRPRNLEAQAAVHEAALSLLLEKGYSGISIEGVALRSGVAKQTIYRWWANKGEIILEAFASWAKRVTALPDTGTLEGDLRAFLEQAFKALSGDAGPINRALVTEALMNKEFAEKLLQQIIEPRRVLLRGLVERAVERGEIAPPDDIETLIDLAFGPMWYRLLITHAPLNNKYAAQLARNMMRATMKLSTDPL